MSIEEVIARAFQLLIAMTGAYVVALWFALVVWTFRDIESRSRSVVAQIFSTLVVVLFFVPGVLIYLILRPKQTLDEAFARSLEEEYLLQDLEDLSLCPTCHRPVRDEFVVCPACYTELRRACPACARLVDLNWAVCAYCATELAPRELEELDEVAVEYVEPPRTPVRMLHERTEVRVEHSRGLVSPEEAPQLPEGEAAQGVIARETERAGSWEDDTGKQAWILTRAREIFRPLRTDEPIERDYRNGHDYVPGDQVPAGDDDEETDPGAWGRAANGYRAVWRGADGPAERRERANGDTEGSEQHDEPVAPARSGRPADDAAARAGDETSQLPPRKR